jgi:hypothetical protein
MWKHNKKTYEEKDMTTEKQERIAELEREEDTDRFVDMFAKEYGQAFGVQDTEMMSALRSLAHKRVGETVRELANEYVKENERRLVN